MEGNIPLFLDSGNIGYFLKILYIFFGSQKIQKLSSRTLQDLEPLTSLLELKVAISERQELSLWSAWPSIEILKYLQTASGISQHLE